jgi:hypothetical protein
LARKPLIPIPKSRPFKEPTAQLFMAPSGVDNELGEVTSFVHLIGSTSVRNLPASEKAFSGIRQTRFGIYFMV